MSKKKQLKSGDKGKAICSTCKKIVTTTYRKSEEWDLAGFCDICDTEVSIPHQSVERKYKR